VVDGERSTEFVGTLVATADLRKGWPSLIRFARRQEVGSLQALERRAGALFREIGMDAISNEEPMSVDELLAFVEDDRAWVATDDRDQPIGYLLLRVLDESGHIEQVSVVPQHGRQGVGSSLLRHVTGWARARGLTALTLTTFADVPWNVPFYARLGFRVVPDDALSSSLREIRNQETLRGLDAWPRVVMRLELSHGGREE
jgi:GNAT superfamily N-acetyltransferase